MGSQLGRAAPSPPLPPPSVRWGTPRRSCPLRSPTPYRREPSRPCAAPAAGPSTPRRTPAPGEPACTVEPSMSDNRSDTVPVGEVATRPLNRPLRARRHECVRLDHQRARLLPPHHDSSDIDSEAPISSSTPTTSTSGARPEPNPRRRLRRRRASERTTQVAPPHRDRVGSPAAEVDRSNLSPDRSPPPRRVTPPRGFAMHGVDGRSGHRDSCWQDARLTAAFRPPAQAPKVETRSDRDLTTARGPTDHRLRVLPEPCCIGGS